MRFRLTMMPITILLGLSLVMVAGCVGARTGAEMSALDDLQDSDPDNIRAHATACDDGDMAACNRVGVWFTVGGAGQARKARGLDWFRHACRNRYQPACRMAADLSRAEQPKVR